jgi:hypothetical protein
MIPPLSIEKAHQRVVVWYIHRHERDAFKFARGVLDSSLLPSRSLCFFALSVSFARLPVHSPRTRQFEALISRFRPRSLAIMIQDSQQPRGKSIYPFSSIVPRDSSPPLQVIPLHLTQHHHGIQPQQGVTNSSYH